MLRRGLKCAFYTDADGVPFIKIHFKNQTFRIPAVSDINDVIKLLDRLINGQLSKLEIEILHQWVSDNHDMMPRVRFQKQNQGSFHSLDKPKFIFVDEGNFLPVGELEEIRHVSERYIAKSNPYIAMVSTPNNLGGLFEQIENESPEQCLYHCMFLDYRLGLGKIYSIHDIEKAKQSPSFEREYDLKFGYDYGNVYLHDEIEHCCNLAKWY
jgi:hypothetical protein